MTQDWPVAELNPVCRMRVIAAATPGAAYAEKLIPAPFSAVWEAASDLEHELPCQVPSPCRIWLGQAVICRRSSPLFTSIAQHARPL